MFVFLVLNFFVNFFVVNFLKDFMIDSNQHKHRKEHLMIYHVTSNGKTIIYVTNDDIFTFFVYVCFLDVENFH